MGILDPVRSLYGARSYPAMSHPSADPAVTAVAAMLVGIFPPHPGGSRVLEIGCASGHNMIPLAQRWPESQFVGVDLSEKAISNAKSLSDATGITNVEWHACDFRTYDPGQRDFDYIIAHGVFSWVSDEVKFALIRFCRDHLSENGIAAVSFNVTSGWSNRFPVIAKVQAIRELTGHDEMASLTVLRGIVGPTDPESSIIDDMLAKGPEILPFDDFAPINDPWSLTEFVALAGAHDLRWLGDSDPAMNLPQDLKPEIVTAIRAANPEPLEFQEALDAATGRTFRSGLLGRMGSPVRADAGQVLRNFHFHHTGRHTASADPLDQAIADFGPSTASFDDLRQWLSAHDSNGITTKLLSGIRCGEIRARLEPIAFSDRLPSHPKLNPFRLGCAERALPLVDAFHKSCDFPANHFQILAAMDGTRTVGELAAFALNKAPELHFAPWLEHLTHRGMFA